MFHKAAAQSGIDNAIAYKTRVGVWMFALYAIVYAGFVIINVTNPVLMEVDAVLGLNLAATYGFGLIIFALVLATIYTIMCSKKEKELNIDTVEEGA